MRIATLPTLFLGSLLAISTPSWAATINASSCAQSAVQTAINSASDGDTVTVPAGSCSWGSVVSISNKTITLKGAGSGTGGTTVTYGGSGHALLSIDPGSKTGKVDVSGFKFTGGDANNWGGTAVSFGGPVGWKNLRIHHNVFDGNKQWTIRGSAATYGLIDNNTFSGSAHGIYLEGRGKTDWQTPLTLGTSDFFFIEDNTFNWNDWYGGTGAVLLDFSNGGRVVFRHNTTKYGFLETHDRARNGSPSANAWEIYGNTFWTNTSKWKGLDLSAGTGVIWGNEFSGSWSVPIGGIDYKTVDPRSIPRCDGNDPADQNTPGQSGWRCQYQIGSQGEGQTAIGYPAYIWSNTLNGASTGMKVTDGANHVVAGRDYYNNGNTPKPGYSSYTYPHPLATGGSTSGGSTGGSTSGGSTSGGSTSGGSTSGGSTSGGSTSGGSTSGGSTSGGSTSGSTTASSIWAASTVPATISEPDASQLELGLKFRTDVAGTVTAIRFYKGSKNTGTHVGHLWTLNGQLLATVTFSNETASGWQQANLASPVSIAAGTYVVSYHTKTGYYSQNENYFTNNTVTNGNLKALADGVAGRNGVYAYGQLRTPPVFPTSSWRATNYWVDVVFKPAS